MTNKTKRFGSIKRIFTNVWRLRSGYCILSLIAFLGAVATLFVLMMYTCASHLNRMMNLPYMEYYLVQKKNETTYAGRLEGFTSELDVDGLSMYYNMIYFDAVEDIFHTTRYRAPNNTLLMYNTSGKAESKPGQYLPVTVVRDSQYDAPFAEGTISLVQGRHLTSRDAAEEAHVLLMEENLAELNGLSLGDTVAFGEESAEYRIVGIFHTNVLSGGGRDNQSMEYNQIYASDKPAGAKGGAVVRDLYIKFKPGISEEDAQMFFSAILVSTVGGSSVYDPANWRMISVEDVNRSLNHGAQTVYRIALWSGIMLLLIVAAAVWVFCTVLLRSRRGEILTLRALGEKNGKTMICFLGELFLCTIPSALVGVGFCLVFLLDNVQNVFLHFANQISVDNIHATSTLYVQDILNFSDDVSTSISPLLAMEYAWITVGAIAAVVVVCGIWHAWQIKRTSTITMLSEKR